MRQSGVYVYHDESEYVVLKICPSNQMLDVLVTDDTKFVFKIVSSIDRKETEFCGNSLEVVLEWVEQLKVAGSLNLIIILLKVLLAEPAMASMGHLVLPSFP